MDSSSERTCLLAEKDPGRKVAPRPGSLMSVKQMAWTVGNRSLVHIHFERAATVVGYVAGMDDYNWLIVTRDALKVLVHKSSPTNIVMDATATLMIEPRVDEIEAVVAPFRQKLIKDGVLPQQPRGESDAGSTRQL